MAFKFITPESRSRVETLSREMKRFHGLTDRWLGEELLRLAREARRLAVRLGNPARQDYDVNFVWQVVPELARRLGAGPLHLNEATDSFTCQRDDRAFRNLIGVYLQNISLFRLGCEVSIQRGDRAAVSALDILGHEFVNGNPVEMAISRLVGPAPANDDQSDWLARHCREVGQYRASLAHGVWQPEPDEIEAAALPEVSDETYPAGP